MLEGAHAARVAPNRTVKTAKSDEKRAIASAGEGARGDNQGETSGNEKQAVRVAFVRYKEWMLTGLSVPCDGW